MKKKIKYFAEALRILSRYWSGYLGMAVCMAIFVVGNYCFPILSEKVVDEGIAVSDIHRTMVGAALLLVIRLIMSISELIKTFIRIKIHNNLQFELKQRAIHQIMNVKVPFFEENNAAEIYQTIEDDTNNISEIAGEGIIEMLTSLFSSIGGVLALLRISRTLAIITLCFLPVQFLVTQIVSWRNMRYSERYLVAQKNYSEKVGELATAIRDIRLFNLGIAVEQDTMKCVENIQGISMRARMNASFSLELEALLVELLLAVLYVASGICFTRGEISIGGILAFLSYAVMVSDPISAMIGIVIGIGDFFPSFCRYFDFLAMQTENQGKEKELQYGDIVFCNVSFGYAREPVLSHINLAIKKGEHIAIIGQNGAGKTTMLNLLLRFIQPDDGMIFLNQRDVREYDISAYRMLFGVVSQELFLFDDTIRNNICLYQRYDDKELIEILKIVRLFEFASSDGLNIQIGKNGTRLSGGQRRKIGIARVLIRKNPIVIFDEIIANLDKETINEIKELIIRQMEGVTVVCVTHDMELAQLFERCYVVKEHGMEQVW